jgi:hypothetical protein
MTSMPLALARPSAGPADWSSTLKVACTLSKMPSWKTHTAWHRTHGKTRSKRIGCSMKSDKQK